MTKFRFPERAFGPRGKSIRLGKYLDYSAHDLIVKITHYT